VLGEAAITTLTTGSFSVTEAFFKMFSSSSFTVSPPAGMSPVT
jgi:hypothetical protein